MTYAYSWHLAQLFPSGTRKTKYKTLTRQNAKSVYKYANKERLFKWQNTKYEACPASKDTKVLNMCNKFNLQKRHCEWIACT
jgi:hypothetical protein